METQEECKHCNRSISPLHIFRYVAHYHRTNETIYSATQAAAASGGSGTTPHHPDSPTPSSGWRLRHQSPSPRLTDTQQRVAAPHRHPAAGGGSDTSPHHPDSPTPSSGWRSRRASGGSGTAELTAGPESASAAGTSSLWWTST